MPDDMRMVVFDVDPAVPHDFVCEISVFGYSERIDDTAHTVVHLAAPVSLRIGKDDFRAA